MDIDNAKVDEAVLALLFLTTFGDGHAWRAWKGHDWDALGRLHEAGFIGDPRSKAKSVVLTDEGRTRSEQLFGKWFGVNA